MKKIVKSAMLVMTKPEVGARVKLLLNDGRTAITSRVEHVVAQPDGGYVIITRNSIYQVSASLANLGATIAC